MILAALAACVEGNHPLPETSRELWRGTIDGDEVAIRAVVDGFHYADDGDDHWRLAVVVSAPYLVDLAPGVVAEAKNDKTALEAELQTIPFVGCPVPGGIAFLTDRWRVAWRVAGGTIVLPMSPEAVAADTTCPAIAWDATAVAMVATDQRACRLVDDAGFVSEAARCVVEVDRKWRGAERNPGLMARYQEDPYHAEELQDAVIDVLIDPGGREVGALSVAGEVLGPGKLRGRLLERCARGPCPPEVWTRAAPLLERLASEPFRADVCDPGTRVAADLLAQGRRDEAKIVAGLLADCPATDGLGRVTAALAP